ncbi:glycosyltransferase family 39 protein [Ancylothrix sp. C2]|uniref:glycosyltransferase family 39 protein n=1 Tax=Ancylothrix sp. D3o TaxID=2953691 RepID=UPI0021BADE29|nr:glycosyltransferase family 39 protein [Ancylothrix sp. D3o]MCT7950826.1 glycosyltransferase family 39 protein [Ancylothrix sp. D3o]
MTQRFLKSAKLFQFFSLDKWLLFAIFLGVFLRFIYIRNREFWYDEVLSLLLATGQKLGYKTPEAFPVSLSDYASLLTLPVESNLGDILTTFKNLLRGLAAEPHPPLFFITQHFWLRLFGNSETAMRSLEVLLSCISIFGAYKLGKIVANHRSGLLLAGLLSLNPFFFFQSLNIRMYNSLILWVIISALASLQIMTQDLSRRQQIFWNILLIFSVTCGLMTFYQYAYFIVALAALALFLYPQNPQKLILHLLRLGVGVLLAVPWMLWGFSQQIKNADLGRFNTPNNVFIAFFLHLRDVAESVGVNLLIGDWQTSLPLHLIVSTGILFSLFLFAAVFILWKPERQKLGIALILSFLPLFIAFAVDCATQKYTLAENSKSIIILPGSLLLLSLAITHLSPRWQKPLIATFLLLYLSLSAGDFSLRNRQMFHTINGIIQQQPTTPTLIAMNARAWGYILRLAYYIKPNAAVMLLAQESANLAPNLEKLFNYEASIYQRILWIDVAAPIWSPASTPAEKQKVENVLNPKFKLTQTQELFGTQDLDKLSIKLYEIK